VDWFGGRRGQVGIASNACAEGMEVNRKGNGNWGGARQLGIASTMNRMNR